MDILHRMEFVQMGTSTGEYGLSCREEEAESGGVS